MAVSGEKRDHAFCWRGKIERGVVPTGPALPHSTGDSARAACRDRADFESHPLLGSFLVMIL